MRWAQGRYSEIVLVKSAGAAHVRVTGGTDCQQPSANAAHMETNMTQTQLDNLSREALIAMVAKMQAAGQRKLTCKVSEKGAVAVYGLGRFPVTLYRSQWEKLIEFVRDGAVSDFIEANASALSVKD